MKINQRQFHFILASISASSLLPTYAFAVETALCKIQPSSIIKENTFSIDGKTHLKSDKVEYNEKGISRFEGNVVIQQKASRIETEQAEYKKKKEQVDAKGNVTFISPDIKIKSETAQFNLKTDEATLEKTQYQFLTGRARGRAEKIEVKENDITEFSQATYTTCDPDNADWLLSANNITLNNNKHQGYASHAVLRFKGVPFFYFPYLRFPLGDDRLSGFLSPNFGRSNINGNELKLPYYWNIHPQLDATITPWYMSKRGTLLNSKIRYLTESNKGTLTTEFLSNDKLVNGDDRERWRWQHESQPSLGWTATAEYNYVADGQHLIDFSDDLASSSKTYLVRSGNATYNMQNWLLNIKAEDHQILRGANPYKRLPQITFNSRYPVKNNEVNYSIQSQAVHFSHEDNEDTAQRLHLKSNITYPMRAAAGFLEPKLSMQFTNYNLQQTTGDRELSRAIPTFSLNSGLFFEREAQIFKNDFIQTLEPQLFYVYVPYQEQSAFPVFDTSVYAFSVNNSLKDYRFNSVDRIGDDNRLTAALATRFINPKNGQEVFMARAGQVYYFADRQVQLPLTAVATANTSDIIAEMKAKLGDLSLSSQASWDSELKEKLSSSSQIAYQYKKFNINLAHRFQLNLLETREVKTNWEINSRWKLNASQLYDIRADHVVEDLLGINYESCCWGLNLSTKQRYIDSTRTDRGIYLELVLKGLGGFGFKQ